MAVTKFVKSHGLGNDYIVLNEADLDFRITPEAVRLLCHRHYGLGSDGILLLAGPQNVPFVLRIFNPDGTEAEKSGNGLRIFAKYLFEHGYTREKTFYIETKGGLVRVNLEGDRDRVTTVTVEMGRASFRSHDIPVAGDEREVVNEEVRRLGPQIEHHPAFPHRTNVQFAKVRSRDRVAILIWERGAGYTLASGSSACAVAAACRRLGLTDDRVTIQMPGGDLDITIQPEWEVTLRGPVSEVYTGTLSADLLEEIKKASPL